MPRGSAASGMVKPEKYRSLTRQADSLSIYSRQSSASFTPKTSAVGDGDAI